MRNIIKFFVGLFCLCAVFSCASKTDDVASSDEFAFIGRRYIKMYVPGPSDETNPGAYHRMMLCEYRLFGHDYFYISGFEVHAYKHSPKCKACQAERERLYNLILNIGEENMNNMDVIATRTDVETMLKTNENNVVRRIDNILDAWD